MTEGGGDPLFSAERWSAVRGLLDALAGLTPERQLARLEQVAVTDAALAGVVRELLGGAQDGVDVAPGPFKCLLPDVETPVPARVGPFRLLQRIGIGGMGVVHLAERSDADFTQRVALKLLDGDVARLSRLAARERRILAALAHPNITAFVDAGVDAGRAWLAMEYVDGDALLDYCRQYNHGIRDRVRLFDQVCAAIAHAHSQLVVHRDLKPANVLVTADGVVKLLDFGIAVVLDPAEEQSPATRVFTPEYAAPEQLRGERVTTGTDVHALGLLLYELISGTRLPTLERGTATIGWTTGKLARHANTGFDAEMAAAELKVVSASLRGDLGRIIAHALEPVAAQRYASVALLREDISRWLGHRPLTIARPGLHYIAARFVRRHRLGAVAASIVALALVAGIAGVVWQARVAQAQAQRATAVKEFLLDIFKRNSIANPDGAQARRTTAEQLLAMGAARIRTQLRDVPEVRAELLGTIGRLYADLALSKPAVALYEEQIRTLRDAHGNAPGDASVAAVQVVLGAALTDSGRTDESTRILQDALHSLDQAGDLSSTTRANAYYYLGQNAYLSLPADNPAAVRQFSEGLRIIQTYHPDSPLLITALLGLARAAEYAGNLDLADTHYRQGLAYALAAGDDHRRLDAASAYQQLGDLLRKRQHFKEAERDLRSAVAIYAESAGADNPWTASAQQDLAKMLADTGRRGEAQKLLTTALQTMLRTRGADDKELVPLLRLDLGSLQYERGEPEAAAESLKTCVDSSAVGSHLHAIALAHYGQTLLVQGRLAEAATNIDDAVAAISRAYGRESGSYARARLVQAELWFANGDPARAQTVFNEVLADWPAIGTTLPPQYVQASADLMQVQIFARHPAAAVVIGASLLSRIQSLPQAAALLDDEAKIRLWLGEAHRLAGMPQQALPDLQRAVILRERLDDPQSPLLARARVAVAECLLDLKRPADARTLLAAAASAQAQHAQLATRFTEPLAAATARLHRT